jgi:hypothetical protein
MEDAGHATYEEHRAPGGTRGAGQVHGGDHSGGGRSLPPALRSTRPQIVAWAIASILALVVGIAYSAYRVNLGLGARDVGGTVMPPGMIMTRDTPGEAMREMAAVDPDEVDYTAPANAQGAQVLEPRIVDGVKEFDLDVSVSSGTSCPMRR